MNTLCSLKVNKSSEELYTVPRVRSMTCKDLTATTVLIQFRFTNPPTSQTTNQTSLIIISAVLTSKWFVTTARCFFFCCYSATTTFTKESIDWKQAGHRTRRHYTLAMSWVHCNTTGGFTPFWLWCASPMHVISGGVHLDLGRACPLLGWLPESNRWSASQPKRNCLRTNQPWTGAD